MVIDPDVAYGILAVALDNPQEPRALLKSALADLSKEELLAFRIAYRDLASAASSMLEREYAHRDGPRYDEETRKRVSPKISPRSRASVAARPGSTRGH